MDSQALCLYDSALLVKKVKNCATSIMQSITETPRRLQFNTKLVSGRTHNYSVIGQCSKYNKDAENNPIFEYVLPNVHMNH